MPPKARRNNAESFATLITVDGFRHDSHSSVAALRDFIHIPGTLIHIALESTIHIIGISTEGIRIIADGIN